MKQCKSLCLGKNYTPEYQVNSHFRWQYSSTFLQLECHTQISILLTLPLTLLQICTRHSLLPTSPGSYATLYSAGHARCHLCLCGMIFDPLSLDLPISYLIWPPILIIVLVAPLADLMSYSTLYSDERARSSLCWFNVTFDLHFRWSWSLPIWCHIRSPIIPMIVLLVTFFDLMSYFSLYSEYRARSPLCRFDVIFDPLLFR